MAATPNLGITLLEENQSQPHVLVNEGFTALDAVAGGVPDGGSAGDRLKKSSGDDFDTEWAQEVVGISVVLDGGGSAIAVGKKVYVEVPFACTITGWTVLGDQSGSIVVDVWKDTYANYPPLVGDSIAGSEKPTISSATKGQDLSLTTWTTAVAAGDILCFNVDSCTTITQATVSLRAVKA